MNTVTDWTTTIFTGVTAGLERFIVAIPRILGAIVILIIGWIISGIIGTLIAKLARAIHVDTVADRVGINDFLSKAGSKLHASDIFGEIVKWVIRLIFIEIAADQLGLAQVTQIINQLIAFIPNIVVALLILGIGAFLGQLLGGLVRGAMLEARISSANVVARITYGAVMAFAIIAALNELNVAPVVVNTLYIGLVAALALALGLAFGLGGRETAARLTDQWVGQAEDTAKRLQAAAPAATPPSANVQGGPTSTTPAPGVRTTPR
ncbi:MAG: small-conductance mechanosensitive ion channel [Candidatus Eremiobacteraeota bacterium]|nr:small-conductance mechanosensitive ion channel [Candidatus Eremiobacteraeota bacterium]